MGNRMGCCKEPLPGGHSRRRAKNYGPPYHSGSNGGDLISGSRSNGTDRYRICGDGESGASMRATNYTGSTSENLPHISEREPEDSAQDPSTNPTLQTMFLARCMLPEAAGAADGGATSANAGAGNAAARAAARRRAGSTAPTIMTTSISSRRSHLRRYSSCSYILVDDSTVSQPSFKVTLKALALAIYYHIRNRDGRGKPVDASRYLEIFDEAVHPLNRSAPAMAESGGGSSGGGGGGGDLATREPEQRAVYKFVRTLFHSAQLTAECAVVALVYLERLLTFAEIDIYPGNWRRAVLGAILLASKVWDDQAVWNVDYCQILRDMHVEDVNELERQFLELIQFNINVPASVYAKYYFDLRTLADRFELSYPPTVLSRQRAYKLEAITRIVDDPFRDMLRAGVRRTISLDSFGGPGWFNRAVLS